jgi:hypothetical protein
MSLSPLEQEMLYQLVDVADQVSNGPFCPFCQNSTDRHKKGCLFSSIKRTIRKAQDESDEKECFRFRDMVVKLKNPESIRNNKSITFLMVLLAIALGVTPEEVYGNG